VSKGHQIAGVIRPGRACGAAVESQITTASRLTAVAVAAHEGSGHALQQSSRVNAGLALRQSLGGFNHDDRPDRLGCFS